MGYDNDGPKLPVIAIIYIHLITGFYHITTATLSTGKE